MWIASPLRIGLVILSAFALWLTMWNGNPFATVNDLSPDASVGKPSLEPLPTPDAFTFRSESDAALTDGPWARFERAELQLPLLVIAFHDNKEECNGHFGYYRSGNPVHIDICRFIPHLSTTAPRKTILHELAHAWDGHNLTQHNRERFLRFRGLDKWGNEQTPWDEQGSEHAAEVIAWALMDRELDMVTIRDADPTTLAHAYELLTATQPPSWARTPITVMDTASPEDKRLVSWAVGRFQKARLILPQLDVIFDPGGKACEGASGRFTDNGQDITVALCTGQEGLTLTNRVAILHELAHAWLIRSVPPEIQTAFLALRGLETWNDRDQPWHLRGVEHAADVIAWALMDQEVWMYRIKPNDSDSLQAAYQLLTSNNQQQNPSHVPGCAASARS